MAYSIIRFFIKLIIFFTVRLELDGFENLLSSGAYIVAANHLGRLDPVLVYYLLDRRDIIMLVAEKYRRIPTVPLIVKILDGIFVDRFNADFSALRSTLKRLEAGGVLVLAPEGTRSQTGGLLKGHPGASYLAAKSGVPVIPAAITGTEDVKVKANLLHFRRSRVVIRAGEPFNLPPLPEKDRDLVLQTHTDEIMCRVAALLPPSYRGVYADHPRLRELLENDPH